MTETDAGDLEFVFEEVSLILSLQGGRRCRRAQGG